MKSFDTVGAHVLADFWGCQPEKLDDAGLLMQALRHSARMARMTILGEEAHKFEPQGFTAMLLLAESHISIHTYPEKGYAAIDVFTCGDGLAQKAIEHLKEVLEPVHVKEVTVKRGIPE
ncbi:MAG: adenosylmethionine decarboxylase [Patescibacteria group bacterium]